MADIIDRVLIDPSREAIVALLGETWDDLSAHAAASATGRGWRIVQLFRREPEEGLASCHESVAVAWWIDAAGRRHVRVRSAAAVRGRPARPPLPCVYPARLFGRHRDGRTDWLAACGCGVVGPPEALGWMGERCGPCHDRREDRAAPPERPAFLRCTSERAVAAAFAPDGRSLAVSEGESVRVWGWARGTSRQVFQGGQGWRVSDVAFSPDGEALALFDAEGQRLTIRGGGRPVPAVLRYAGGGRRSAPLAFVADDLLLVGGTASAAYRRGPGGWRQEASFAPGFSALARCLRTGAVAVGGRGTVAAFDAESCRPDEALTLPGTTPRRVEHLAWMPDGATLFAVLEGSVPNWGFGGPPPRPACLCRLSGTPAVEPAGPVPAGVPVALSPDGRLLAGARRAEYARFAEVVFWEVPSGQEVARLEGMPQGHLVDVCFSPDGETLATVSADGVVQLWPWRRLLEA
jgi:hypothetical protein